MGFLPRVAGNGDASFLSWCHRCGAIVPPLIDVTGLSGRKGDGLGVHIIFF